MEEYLGSVCGTSITEKAHKKKFTYTCIYAHDNVHVQICCLQCTCTFSISKRGQFKGIVFSYHPVGLA